VSSDFAPPSTEQVDADVARALAEDIGGGDVTAALLPDAPDIAYLLCKEDAVVCGRPVGRCAYQNGCCPADCGKLTGRRPDGE